MDGQLDNISNVLFSMLNEAVQHKNLKLYIQICL